MRASVSVNRTVYTVEKTIGSGGYAHVYRCRPSSGGDAVAVKVLQASDAVRLREAESEAALLRSLPFHPNLVALIAAESSRTGRLAEVALVLELMGESLFQHMAGRQQNNELFDPPYVLHCISQVASALAHLHKCDVTHRDCKPENILQALKGVPGKPVWKLCDFGSCVKGEALPSDELQRQALRDDLEAKTSLSYRSPEMLDFFRCQAIGPAADVWALGVTTFFATWLVQPFADGELAVLNGRYTFPSVRGGINAIVVAALQQEPAARPDARAIHSMCERELLLATASPEVQATLALQQQQQQHPVSPRSIRVGALPSGGGPSPRPSPPQLSPRRAPPAAPGAVAAAKAPESGSNNDAILLEGKQCLADVKDVRDPDAWRLEISAEVRAPSAKDVNVRAFKVASRPFAGTSKSRVTDLFALFRDFTPRSSGDAFQMLSIFHLALQSGSFLAVACGSYRRPFLEELAQHGDPIVRSYASFLLEKVSFHAAHRFVEGNMSLGTYHMIVKLNAAQAGAPVVEDLLITTELMTALLGLLDRAISLEAKLLQIRDENPAIGLFLIPVVKETFSVAVLMGYLGRTHPRVDAGAQGFAQRMEGLKQHYDVVREMPVVLQAMGSAPDLSLVGVVPSPPSHSPFVKAFLEQERFASASPAATAVMLPAQFEAKFDSLPGAHFEARFESSFDPQPVLQSDQQRQVAQAPPPPADAAASPVARSTPKDDTPPPSPPPPVLAAVASSPASSSSPASAVLPAKERLRRVGSRRGSVQDIAKMREESVGDLSAAEFSRGLDGMTREQLVEEVVSLRRKVASLETALGAYIVGGRK